MRTALIPYKNQYVLAKGWITDWKDYEKTQIRRVYVSNIAIKRPDKNLTFENQELISKEDHLNFFIPIEYVPYTPCEKYTCLGLAGCITEYTRKDGSIDYGLKPIAQSIIEDSIASVCERARLMTNEKVLTPKTLMTLYSLNQQMVDCDKQLEEVGDLLPTFYRTYADYKKDIKAMIKVFEEGISLINSICSNRAMRRKNKIKGNFASTINEWYGRL
jgi:hypothetical protein